MVDAVTGPEITIDASTLGRPVVVKPVQPPVEKLPGAIERAVFQMDPTAYQIDADVSGARAAVQELGRAGGQRLCLLEIRPVGYNPVKQVLTVYPSITAMYASMAARCPWIWSLRCPASIAWC